MAEIRRIWRDSKPPKPDVYLTRRGNTRHEALRFWDGVEWWTLRFEREGFTPKNAFQINWNRKSYEPYVPSRFYGKYVFWSRKISDQDGMKWGERYKHLTDTEVLNYLIELGEVPPDVRKEIINLDNGSKVL